MYRKKSIIRRLIPWLIILAALAALVIFVFVPIFSEKEQDNSRKPDIIHFEGSGDHIVMQNDNLIFDMDPESTQFEITEVKTGKVWKSNPISAEQYEDKKGKNDRAEQIATLFISYYEVNGAKDSIWDNYNMSIKNRLFEIETEEKDGSVKSVRVNYTMGNVEREYVIPNVMTKERYDEVKKKLKGSAAKKMESCYSRISPDDFAKKTDNEKDTLLKQYQGVGEETLYVIKETAGSDNKDGVENALRDAGYTAEDFDRDKERMLQSKDKFSGHLYNISVIYELDGNDLIVRIPYDEIRYESEHPMNTISVLPYFGAAGEEEEGFLFVPEGGGGIIRYNNGKINTTSHTADIYGWDYARQRSKDVSIESRVSFPVFGASQQGGSYICIPEGAVSYLQINADIAGKENNFYNMIYGKYIAMHADKFAVSARTNNEVNIFEAAMPGDEIIQRYRFVESESYTDMALAYREYLIEKNPETLAQAKASEEMPVSVEIVGAINKNIVKLGIPVDSVVATTTFSQAADILSELSSSGVKELNVRMSGWSNGGVRQKVLTGVHVLNELGGEKGMKELSDQAARQGISLYFDGITCFAYNSGITDGFLPYNNAAKFATREQVHLFPISIATFRKAEWQEDYYLVKPSYAKENASRLISKLKELNVKGIAFRDIGFLLSADYNPKDLVTREQTKQMNIDTMKEAAAAGQKVMIKEGNDYALPYADIITDMNLTGQKPILIDELVPFYQIAIHGLKNYTGEPINMEGDYEQKILECAEFGAGLNFTFMAEDTKVLQDTFYSRYMSTQYAKWKGTVTDLIVQYQNDMKGLNQTAITGHELLTEDVHVTTYKDGTKVYVNYGRTEYEGIPGRTYKVETAERGNGQ